MKIVFSNRFFYPDHSATSQILSDLAFALAAGGYEIHIITSALGYEKNKQLKLAAFEKIRGVSVHRVWSSGFGRRFLLGRIFDYLTFYLFSTWRLYRLLDAGDISVAKTDPPMLSVTSGKVAAWRRARSINWIQDLFPEVAVALPVRGFGGRLAGFLIELRNRSLARAEMNVVIGERMKQHLRSEGVADSLIRVIHNWTDETAIQPVQDGESRLREEWGLAGKFIVAYSGNLGRAHEYRTLLDAAIQLQEHQDIHFLFIGGGSQMQALQTIVESREMHNISFRPYLPRQELPRSLAFPDIHLVILRPEMEGLIVPSKIYGILAAGRPTLFIGDSQGEIATLLQEADAGVSISPGDSATLVEQILFLRANPQRLGSMGENARRTLERHFTAQRAFSAWKEIVDSVGS